MDHRRALRLGRCLCCSIDAISAPTLPTQKFPHACIRSRLFPRARTTLIRVLNLITEDVRNTDLGNCGLDVRLLCRPGSKTTASSAMWCGAAGTTERGQYLNMN